MKQRWIISFWVALRASALTLILASSVAFTLGFALARERPRLEIWLLEKIDRISREHLPFRILPQSVEISLLPLVITIHETQFSPKPEFSKIIKPFQIHRIDVRISITHLLRGDVVIRKVDIEGADLEIAVPENKDSGEAPLKGLFALLDKIPLERLSIGGLKLQLLLPTPKASLSLEDITLLAEKSGRHLEIGLDIPIAIASLREGRKQPLRTLASAKLKTVLEPDHLEINEFEIRRGLTFVRLDGKWRGDIETMNLHGEQLSVDSSIDVGSIVRWLKSWDPKKFASFPQLGGTFDLRAQTAPDGKGFLLGQQAFPALSMEIRANQFSVDRMRIGNIAASGMTLSNQVLRAPLLTLNQEGVDGVIRDIQFELGSSGRGPFHMTGDVEVTRASLFELLQTLGIGKFPLWFAGRGKFPCQADFEPSFKLTCEGKIDVENIKIQVGMNDPYPIFSIPKISGEGHFSFDTEQFTFETNLSAPKSSGKASGSAGYHRGFDIQFSAQQLDFSDLAPINGIHLEGAAKFSGTSHGTTDYGIIDAAFEGSDLWMENYWLGYPEGKLNYKAGVLSFQGMHGRLQTTRYSGDMVIDIPGKSLSIIGKAPFIDLQDVTKALSRHFQIPVGLTGTGQGEISVKGPLNPVYLSYDLRSSFYRGTLAGENYDQVHMDLKSTEGNLQTQRVELRKGNAIITVNGEAHPDQSFKMQGSGRGVRIEETQALEKLRTSLSGLLDFNFKVEGNPQKAETTLDGTLSQTIISEQSVGDSQFHVALDGKSIAGQASLLGKNISSEFILPQSPGAPFKLNVDVVRWNFAPIFQALFGASLRRHFDSTLSSKIQLSAASGGFWNSTGSIEIQELAFRRGPLELSTKSTQLLRMEQGDLSTSGVELTGNGTYLRVTGKADGRSRLNLRFDSKLDLSLLAILTPFLEELRGLLSVSASWRSGFREAGAPLNEVFGSALIERGHVKFYYFPHALEEIDADFVFNHNRIFLNSGRSLFAGGRAKAEGAIDLVSSKNIPVDISGTFEKVTLLVPEGYKTSGDGQFRFFGSWFPYTFKTKYDITDGLVTAEFQQAASDTPSTATTFRREDYLPKFLLEENFTPIVLDIEMNFPDGLPLRNSLADGRGRGSIRSVGPPQRPIITGTIQIDPGSKILSRDNVFEVSVGSVTFDDPKEINPKLVIQAKSRVQDYDINLLFQGTPKKPELTFTSTPPLPQKDILSLLALGVTDQKLDTKVQGSQQGASTGQAIATSALNPLARKIGKQFGFEVQLSTGFDDTNEAVPKVTVSRRVTQRLGVTGARSFGRKSETEAKVKYGLTEHVSVVGSWLGKDFDQGSDATAQSQREQDKLGLDFEYKFEFK